MHPGISHIICTLYLNAEFWIHIAETRYHQRILVHLRALFSAYCGEAFLLRSVSTCPVPSVIFKNHLNSTSSNNYRLAHSFVLKLRYYTMSKIYQNLLFISLFLLSHLLPPNMSQWVPGSTCPKDKTQVCCYGTPLSCYSWTWPCEEFEIAQCCRRIDVCLPLLNISQMHRNAAKKRN